MTKKEDKEKYARNSFFPCPSMELIVKNRDHSMYFNPGRSISASNCTRVTPVSKEIWWSPQQSHNVSNLGISQCKSWELECPPPIMFPPRRGISVDSVIDPIKLRLCCKGQSSLSQFKVSDHFEQQNEFPVKPYYPDKENLPPIIPPRLQVKVSSYTLRFCKNRIDASNNSETVSSDGVARLEKNFFELRFQKSRRLIRCSILIILFVTILRILLDDCALLGNGWYKISICTKDLGEMNRRRWIFCAFQLPICVIWFWTTFWQFYSEHIFWLPPTFILLYGLSAMASTIIGKHPEILVYMGYFIMVWIFTRVPFWIAFCISSETLISWVIAINCLHVYQDKALNIKAEWLVDFMWLVCTNISLGYAAYSWECIDRAGFIDSQVAAHIRSNTQKLLNQLIPAVVKERIQRQVLDASLRGGHPVSYYVPIADKVAEVSILFSDIKGFTEFCSGVEAVDVVRNLNRLYMTFDRVLEKLKVYKVETIGDAYFVSANCPIKAKDHARRLVYVGRAMIEICSKFHPVGTLNKNYKFGMRIGIHSGQVIAGVVGYKMPRYHLFGQTVSVAECMERSGKPGKIQISERTRTYLEDWRRKTRKKMGFAWRLRGRQEVIPNVFLETYFIKF